MDVRDHAGRHIRIHRLPFCSFFSKDDISSPHSEPKGRIVLYAFGLLTALLTSSTCSGSFPAFNGGRALTSTTYTFMNRRGACLGHSHTCGALHHRGWFALPAFFQGPDHFANFLAPVLSGMTAEAPAKRAYQLEMILAGVAWARP